MAQMMFTPNQPLQKKAEMDFEFEDRFGTQIVTIYLDKNRVAHQYQFGDKDLLKLQRKLNAHIKEHGVGKGTRSQADTAITED